METQEQHWERVKGAASQGLPYCSCLLELRDRVEALEANMNGIAWAFEVATDPQPIATNEELQRCYGWAFMEAVQKGDAAPEATELAHRAVYDLGRQHGAAANSKPTPNFAQIRSSTPAGGLKEMLARVRNEGSSLRGYAATDVIEVVADWFGAIAACDNYAHHAAALLRKEANR